MHEICGRILEQIGCLDVYKELLQYLGMCFLLAQRLLNG